MHSSVALCGGMACTYSMIRFMYIPSLVCHTLLFQCAMPFFCNVLWLVRLQCNVCIYVHMWKVPHPLNVNMTLLFWVVHVYMFPSSSFSVLLSTVTLPYLSTASLQYLSTVSLPYLYTASLLHIDDFIDVILGNRVYLQCIYVSSL